MNYKIVLAIAIGAVSVLLLVPGALGIVAQRQQAELIPALENRLNVTVVEQHYQRGWFRSTSRHRILKYRDGRAPDRADAEIVVDSVITHGPLPLAGSLRNWRPGVARIDSGVTWVSDGQTRRLPGSLSALIGPRGGGALRYISGPVHETLSSGRVLEWQGGSAYATFDADLRTFAVTSDLSTIDLQGRDALLDAGPITVTGELEQNPDGFWVGGLDVNVASLGPRPAAAAGPLWQLDNLSLVVSVSDRATLAGVANGRLGQLTTRVAAESVRVGDWNGGEAALEFRLADFDVAAFDAFLATVSEDGMTGSEESLIFDGPAMVAMLRALLEQGGTAELVQLRVPTPNGDLSAQLRISLSPPSGPTPPPDIWSIMEAQFSLRVPRALTDRAASNDSVPAQVIRNVLGYGLLRPEGDHYAVKAGYGGGVLTVNGASLPYPPREPAATAGPATFDSPVAAQ